MGKYLDEYVDSLEAELRTGGGATLDELYSLAVALQLELLPLAADSVSPPLTRRRHDRTTNPGF